MPARAPWLVIAFLADLVALCVVTIVAGVDAATGLQLDWVAVALAGALAGAQVPVGKV